GLLCSTSVASNARSPSWFTATIVVMSAPQHTCEMRDSNPCLGAWPRRASSARLDLRQVEGFKRHRETPAEASGECGDVVASDNSDFFPQRRLQKPPAFAQLLERCAQLLHLLGGGVRSLRPFVAAVVKRREGQCVDIVRRCLLDGFI